MTQPSPSDLGLTAYLAYSEATGGTTHDDRPMPAWEDLGEVVQGAWIAAAATVAGRVATSAEQESSR